jgi:hypothetical protein
MGKLLLGLMVEICQVSELNCGAVFDAQWYGIVSRSQAFNFGQSHFIFDCCGLIRYLY